MRLVLTIVVSVVSIVLASPAAANADSASAGVETTLTRYGTSHQTLYQLNLEPQLAVSRGDWTLTIITPVTGGYTVNISCCRFTMGNVSLGTTYGRRRGRARWWLNTSVSLPTSELTNNTGYASGVAATAAIVRDAGYYLPETTTVRANAGGAFAITRRVSVGAHVGTHYWLHHDQATNQLVVPTTVFGKLNLGRGWSSGLALRNIVNLGSDQERWLHEVSARLIHTWSVNTLSATVAVPTDDSLRALAMVSAGVSFTRSF